MNFGILINNGSEELSSKLFSWASVSAKWIKNKSIWKEGREGGEDEKGRESV